MTRTTPSRPAGRTRPRGAPGGTRPAPVRRRSWVRPAVAAVAVGAVLLVLFAIFQTSRTGDTTSGGAPATYQVGAPGVGAAAPPIRLAATSGGQVDLAAYRGKTVLLYFQEGLSCQPCWDQIRDLEQSRSQLRAAGVDQLLSITTDPVGLLTQKVRDEGLSTPVLSDPDLAVSATYQANRYGMMGTSRDGHSFILVDPDGKIRWRADYGGAPRYTMYVPVTRLLTDLRTGQRPS
ncbi:peroxiredoxin family protein [Frankia sp. Cppng1_Ct_nod]|uniref:peroxiredoxin family protein n=1 Tax=Frankia sp. Cppng1_Ct_nod TaxID=2897162 RepID=UPI00104194E9|nr:peroxiredoxin family protein [Frankia sp. Cppng1_Ct_nod]